MKLESHSHLYPRSFHTGVQIQEKNEEETLPTKKLSIQRLNIAFNRTTLQEKKLIEQIFTPKLCWSFILAIKNSYRNINKCFVHVKSPTVGLYCVGAFYNWLTLSQTEGPFSFSTDI